MKSWFNVCILPVTQPELKAIQQYSTRDDKSEYKIDMIHENVPAIGGMTGPIPPYGSPMAASIKCRFIEMVSIKNEVHS